MRDTSIGAYIASQIKALERGRLDLSPDEEALLHRVFSTCGKIRDDLVEAMGLPSINLDRNVLGVGALDQDRDCPLNLANLSSNRW
ncbi:MAG: hypothetical protein OXR62_07690 [Ahrensia sp.]|nr:hypothetical protein [Ahrensia sp.]